jgi:anti-sigma B factor antagonist
MQLRMESRPVGDVLVIQCHGRIVAGNEVYTLHAQVGDSVVKYGDVVLQLDQVEFVDSSGLGALVRLVQAARAKGGDLKLSGVPPRILKTLSMTNLLSQFETYDSVEEAITAAYWARAMPAEKATQGPACFAFASRRMWARSCGRCCAARATTR